ncbi:MAG: HEPN domain-containing protein [Nanoarchaeota archaeon]|nr:HEPN domain-containing protein [Nanoarchaeota archaeon]
MSKQFWEVWLEDEEKRDADFQKYLASKKIKKETETKELVQGHIEKADHNLKFVKSTLDLKEFNDWAIVSAYYTIYHASLALCSLKGYSTKDHSATLLILIKEFYNQGLDEDEIEMISSTTIEKEEVLYYIEARSKRTKASYSTQKIFDRKEAESIRLKAIAFVNKVKEIIESID